MEETIYRHAKGEINRLPCVFEAALLGQHAVCELSVRHSVNGHQKLACAQPLARASCGTLDGLLQEKSAFAIRRTDAQRRLPKASVMKIQCGGLNGLRSLLDPQAHAPNVVHLVRLAQEKQGGLAQLPFAEIIKSVAAWKPSRRIPDNA